MGRDREDQEKLDAELGYSVRGEREVKLREWLSLREEGEGPRDFKRLVWRLQQRRVWAKKAPEKKARIFAYRRKWERDNKESYRAKVEAARRKRRARKVPSYVREKAAQKAQRAVESQELRASLVFTCVVCEAQWCTLIGLPRGFKPKYCAQPCKSRAQYLREKAAGKRGVGVPTDPPRDTPKEEMP